MLRARCGSVPRYRGLFLSHRLHMTIIVVFATCGRIAARVWETTCSRSARLGNDLPPPRNAQQKRVSAPEATVLTTVSEQAVAARLASVG